MNKITEITIKKAPKKILIVKPSSLGDIMHSLPFLQATKDTFPSSEIHWVITKGLEGLLEDHPLINKLYVIKKDQWKNLRKIKENIAEVRKLFKELNEAYDMVVDLQGLLRSGLLSYAAKAPIRVGFKEAREGSSFFYTHKVIGGEEIHAVDRYLKIAAAFGCKIEKTGFPMPPIKELEKAANLKKELGDYAVIVPGARWKTKIWHYERFGTLALMLDIKTVIVGSEADIEISKSIEDKSDGKALSIAGKTDIKELICIIRNARYVISNDSGPMHIASALGIPVVAIFGPTNPVRTGPYGDNHITLKSDISCSPCYKKSCKNIRCMDDISVEKVYDAINYITL